MENEQIQSYITELRRGSLMLAVLGSLGEPRYGYALLEELQGRNITIEANTLYPLLRRLDGQELLTSDWDTSVSRPRKYYKISEKGAEVLRLLLAEREKIERSIDEICKTKREDDDHA